MARWYVELVGEPVDLQQIAEMLRGSEIRLEQRAGAYYLTGSVLEGSSGAAGAMVEAEEQILRINGAARLRWPGTQPIEAGVAVEEDRGDGAVHRSVYLQVQPARMRLSGSLVVVKVGGTTPSEPPPSVSELALGLAQSNQEIARALRLFGRAERRWVNLYAVYDVVKGFFRGEEKMCEALNISRNQIRLFRHTADHPDAVGDEARHGQLPGAAPSQPMPLAHAESLVSDLLKNWVQWLSGQTHPGPAGDPPDAD